MTHEKQALVKRQASNPQIYLGLLVTVGGYAIGYDMFEGNVFEARTFIPFNRKDSLVI